MAHEAIIPEGSAPPLAPYSPGVKVGETVYVSGVLSMDGNGNIVGLKDIKKQTRQVIETIKSVVETAGGSLSDIAFNQIFLADLSDYADMNDPEIMPKGLLNLHQEIDTIVEKCYQSKTFLNDEEKLKCLFDMYADKSPESERLI